MRRYKEILGRLEYIWAQRKDRNNSKHQQNPEYKSNEYACIMHFKPYICFIFNPSDQVDQVISLVINVYAKFWTTDQFRIYQQAIWHEEMDESAVMNISDKRESVFEVFILLDICYHTISCSVLPKTRKHNKTCDLLKVKMAGAFWNCWDLLFKHA